MNPNKEGKSANDSDNTLKVKAKLKNEENEDKNIEVTNKIQESEMKTVSKKEIHKIDKRDIDALSAKATDSDTISDPKVISKNQENKDKNINVINDRYKLKYEAVSKNDIIKSEYNRNKLDPNLESNIQGEKDKTGGVSNNLESTQEVVLKKKTPKGNIISNGTKDVTNATNHDTWMDGNADLKNLKNKEKHVEETNNSHELKQETVPKNKTIAKTTNSERVVDEESTNTSEIDKKVEKIVIGSEILQKAESERKAHKNNKLRTFFKNIQKPFQKIGRNIKQCLEDKKIRRKARKEAKRLEKERLKNMKKTLSQRKPLAGEREWFWNQYEKYIGLPKTRNANPAYVLGRIRMQSYCRFVPESTKLWCKWKRRKDSTFLAWNGPKFSNCMCPHRECFCRGDMVLPPKRIPCVKRCDGGPMYILRMIFCFRLCMPEARTKNFVNKLVALADEEAQRYNTLYKTGVFQQMGPEICLLSCQHYKKPGERRTMKYLPIELKPAGKEVEEKKVEEEEMDEEDESERICNIYSCTVASQTDTGPDGELIVGKISHFVYADVKDSVLPDLEGKKLQISTYERKYEVRDNQMYVRRMEKLMNMKEIKSRISKIISSIIEIKDPGVPVTTRATQIPCCTETCNDNEVTSHKSVNEYPCGHKDYDSLPKIPCSEKIRKSLLEAQSDKIDDKSSCTCCKSYRESFDTSNNVETNYGKNRKRDLNISKYEMKPLKLLVEETNKLNTIVNVLRL